jgi:hypothetical protein
MAEHGQEVLFMRITIFAFFSLLISWKQGFSQIPNPFAVVELFTSEGCSNCPAAEKVLSDIHADAEKNKKNIFCLEYHVDYWNRLGWKDPYSNFQNTLRQKNYTSVLNEEGIYTPMMVVNGQTAFTGSDAAKAKSAIDAALSVSGSMQLKVKIDSLERDTIFVSFQTSKADNNLFIRVAITEDQLVSKVGKGENAGRTLTHDHVVRVLFSGEVKQMASQLKIPLKKFVPNKNCGLIAFIQHKQTMKILAATGEDF